jgi:prophage antirepressor-like protein
MSTSTNEKILKFENEKHTDIIPYIGGSGTSNLLPEMSTFEINQFFNGLPIRILGSHVEPFFYAEDIGKILNIKRIRKTVANFDPIEIASPEQRRKHNIVTYKIDGRRDNTKILLTEFGLYRIIMINKSELAEQFRLFMYRVLHELRINGYYKINAELQQLKTVNEELLQKTNQLESFNTELIKKQDKFKNLCEQVHLLQFTNDIWKINQDLPKKFSKKSGERVSKKFNEINNPLMYARMLDKELNLNTPFIETDPDTNLADLKYIHNQNTQIAINVIENHAPKFSYFITDKITPELLTMGTSVHKVWVRNSKTSLDIASKQLQIYKPIHIKDRYNFYTCDKQKIIDVMNAIEE